MKSTLHNHIHHRKWIINWLPTDDPQKYDIWIDDPEGDCCFEYKECLELTMGIEFCRLAIDSIINQNTIAMFNLFDLRSTYLNNLHNQIGRYRRDTDDENSY